ncbi:MAG: hypothetical protein HY943_03915 [Gammaproteobacteria bacterium]|nr:hypothetical protein [Gammaproteobacteria bacterium]
MISHALFWLFCATVLGLPLLPALGEWWRKTDAAPLRVVREQDTNIRHFAHSFHDHVWNLFAAEGIDTEAPPAPYSGRFRPGETFLFLGHESRPAWPPEVATTRAVRDVVIGLGDLLLEGNLVFTQEIYCGGQIYAGGHSTFRAIYAGTDLILGPNCVVARWLHSQGHVHVGPDSRIYGRVSSGTSITLGLGTRFERLNAPEIRFTSDDAVTARPAAGGDAPQQWWPDERFRALDPLTYTTRIRQVAVPAAMALIVSLVAPGELVIGEGSQVTGSLKANGRLRLGANCVVHGAIVSAGPIEIGSGCVIKGPVISEESIIVASACILGTPELPTSVTAPVVHVAAGSKVCGTLWAAREGLVAPETAMSMPDGKVQKIV